MSRAVDPETGVSFEVDKNGHEIRRCPYCGCRLKYGSLSYDEGFCIESAYTAGACREDNGW